MELPPTSGGTIWTLMTNQLVALRQNGLSAPLSFLLNSEVVGGIDNGANDSLITKTGRALEREWRMGLRALLAVGLVAGGWAVLVPLAGAVIVPGNLVVQSSVKTI